MFVYFWSILDPSGSPKSLKNQWVFNIFAYFAWSLLRSILDRFLIEFGPQNRPKIGPKKLLKAVENHCCFWLPSWTSKNWFLCQHGRNMARFGPPKWHQVGPKMVPKSLPTAYGAPWGAHGPPWGPSEPILDRFWADFGSILDRFYADVGRILGQFLIDFW